MSAKHRMCPTPQQSRPAVPAARRWLGIATVCDVISASTLCAAALTALVLNAPHDDKRTVEASQEPPSASQPVRQEGTVIAVSAGSVTARSANGYTQTYLVTPNTTLIGHGGGQPATVIPHFTVNDHVEIVGTIQDGTALATAVADRDAGNGDGPPMDYLDGQIVPAGRT
ncbi:hypothetical protein [Mycobacterium paraseoulense]|uniref:hypothetical protein n=1 Tax=Mycobacterium paraseoulense TaxID=590652 RepID=UPI0009F27BC5|nr:hypothetical protein [Mycobacterium paraseoulense]MCV7396740.1 hypothetical protein [Mycobacterium paraseoulense]